MTGGLLILPTRLAPLAPRLKSVLLLDEIKMLAERYNRQTGQHLVVGERSPAGWCGDCWTYLEAGQRCGCRA